MVVPLRSDADEMPWVERPAVRMAARDPTYVDTVITLHEGRRWKRVTGGCCSQCCRFAFQRK